MQHQYFVYIMASRRNGTLYIGVTNNLLRRVWEHREGLIEGFTNEHRVKHLVYFEEFERRHPSRDPSQEMETPMENRPHPAR
jgi:putative endonuclease